MTESFGSRARAAAAARLNTPPAPPAIPTPDESIAQLVNKVEEQEISIRALHDLLLNSIKSHEEAFEALREAVTAIAQRTQANENMISAKVIENLTRAQIERLIRDEVQP
jgi:hypothetical protein